MKPIIRFIATSYSLDTLKSIIQFQYQEDINRITINDIIEGKYSELLDKIELVLGAEISLQAFLSIYRLIRPLLPATIIKNEHITTDAYTRSVERAEKAITLLLEKDLKLDKDKYHISPWTKVRIVFAISLYDLVDMFLPQLFSSNEIEQYMIACNILSIICLLQSDLLEYISKEWRKKEFWKQKADKLNSFIKQSCELALRSYGPWNGYECIMMKKF